MADRQVILIGFMGSGKTTVGQALAATLNCQSVDLDRLITEKEDRTPQEIIKADGEEEFRKRETSVLRKLLAEKSARVLSVGGGLWTITENRRLIREHGLTTVWLDAPFELCWKRIEGSDETRPLARTKESAQKLYDERRQIYESADFRVQIDGDSTPAEIAEDILRALSTNTRRKQN